jgi:hypothetical protein
MDFGDARNMAAGFGAKLAAFDHTSPVAGCWIGRIECRGRGTCGLQLRSQKEAITQTEST